MKRTRMHWAADIAAGLGGLLALGAVVSVIPEEAREYVAAAGAAVVFIGKWLEQHIPARTKSEGEQNETSETE
jgi:hypothetical protein